VVINTIAAAIARALAGAPGRAATQVTDTVGSLIPFSLGGHQDFEPIVLKFGVGETFLDGAARTLLGPVIEALQDDDSLEVRLEHELGEGDVVLARQRGNPSEQDCRLMLQCLQYDWKRAAREREQATLRVQAALISGLTDEVREAVERLRSLERTLGCLDQAVDHVYGLLSPRAALGVDRRAREAALDLAKARLSTIERELWSQVPNAVSRIRVIPPHFSEPETGTPGTVTLVLRRTAR
jgi:hypothetical protein